MSPKVVPFAILSCQNYEEYASTPYKQDASRCGSLLYASGLHVSLTYYESAWLISCIYSSNMVYGNRFVHGWSCHWR